MVLKEFSPGSGEADMQWHVDFPLSDVPHSPSEAIRFMEIVSKLGRYCGVPLRRATLYYLQDRQLLADPTLQKSIRQMEVGELIEITHEIGE